MFWDCYLIDFKVSDFGFCSVVGFSVFWLTLAASSGVSRIRMVLYSMFQISEVSTMWFPYTESHTTVVCSLWREEQKSSLRTVKGLFALDGTRAKLRKAGLRKLEKFFKLRTLRMLAKSGLWKCWKCRELKYVSNTTS